MAETEAGPRRLVVTGARGFIGRNLVTALGRRPGVGVAEIDLQTGDPERREALLAAEAVFHLAGVNRPERVEEFDVGNAQATRSLCDLLREGGRRPLVVLSSSTQAALDNPYGRSKRAAEDAVLAYGRETGAPVRVFRLPGVFGKWCRPNYNSVVATFCHNVARGIPIEVSDPAREIDLVHVDDVVRAFVGLLDGAEPPREGDFCAVRAVHRASLGELARLVTSFRDSRRTLEVPDLSDELTRVLHSTYVSYLPEDGFAYALEQRRDPRGELAELLRSARFGQIFVSRTRPGIARGNHYHDAKVEKFVVVEGEALIRFRSVLGAEVLEYPVSGREFKVVDIPPGYTHDIRNVGTGDMVVLFWASERFDPGRPDTYAKDVQP
jgi:UDP-2-acetamido-2,6-beta-L-arabino-hexul-4-ose reductase